MYANEAKAALEMAASDAETAISQVMAARQLLVTSLQMSRMIRDTSVDPIGVPSIVNAIERLDKSIIDIRAYIDATETYANGI